MATILADVKYNVNTKDLDKANRKLKDTKKSTKSLVDSAKGLNVVSNAFKGVAAAVVVASAAFLAMDAALQTIDKIAKSAKNIGITAEAFQELSHAASLSGVSVDLFQKSFLKLEKASIDAQAGLTTVIRAFNDMGIEVKDLIGLSPEELFNKTADGIMSIEDPVKRAAAAMQIFGTRGADMIEMMSKGSSSINEMRKAAQDLGLVMSNELAARVETANDELQTMKQVISVQWTEIWATWATKIIDVSSAFVEAAVSVSDFISKFSDDVSTRSTRSLKKELKEVNKELVIAQEEVDKTGAALLDLGGLFGQGVSPGAKLRLEEAAERKRAIAWELYLRKLKGESFDANQKRISKETTDAAIASKKKAEQEKKDLAFIKISSKLEDEATTIRIANIDNESARLTAFYDVKQKKAEDEIRSLELNIERESELLAQAAANRNAIEVAAQEKLAAEKAKIREADLAAEQALLESNKSLMEQAADYHNDITKRMEEATVGWAENSADALTEFVMTGKADFKGLAKSIIADIVKMIIKQQIFNALSMGGGAVAANGITTSGTITPMAKGDILTKQTRFAVGGGTGLAGESGPEAIMPLKRGRDGKLGVASSNNGGTIVHVQVINNSQAQIKQETVTASNGDKIIKLMVEDAIGGMVQNGRMDKLLSPYGIRRSGVR